jgi:hypothetical protein
MSGRTWRSVSADVIEGVRCRGDVVELVAVQVGMSRGRDDNQAYTRVSGEADHEHAHLVAGGEVHELRRGTK